MVSKTRVSKEELCPSFYFRSKVIYLVPRHWFFHHWFQIWHHTFHNELMSWKLPRGAQCCSDRSSIESVMLVSLGVWLLLEYRCQSSRLEKMTQIMFETFNVPAILNAASFHDCNRGVDIKFECGDGVSSVVPVFGGVTLPQAVFRLDMGGVTWLSISWSCCPSVATPSPPLLSGRLCTTSRRTCVMWPWTLNRKWLPAATHMEKSYKLQDGRVITLGNECFRCPEALFKPSLMGIDCVGIHELIYNSIMSCDIDTRHTLFMNIALFGGSVMFPGFPQRLQAEISALASFKAKKKWKSSRSIIGNTFCGKLVPLQQL